MGQNFASVLVGFPSAEYIEYRKVIGKDTFKYGSALDLHFWKSTMFSDHTFGIPLEWLADSVVHALSAVKISYRQAQLHCSGVNQLTRCCSTEPLAHPRFCKECLDLGWGYHWREGRGSCSDCLPPSIFPSYLFQCRQLSLVAPQLSWFCCSKDRWWQLLKCDGRWQPHHFWPDPLRPEPFLPTSFSVGFGQ